jgi:hypothetical protein
MSVGRRYELAVPAEDYERAKAVLDIEDDLPATSSEEDWAKLEVPDDDSELEELPQDVLELDAGDGQSFSDEFTQKLQQRRDAYLSPWYPEDATTEIWSKPNSDRQADAIEMALKEHFIHCRVDKGGGAATVFVQPQDESLARNVVQDIISAGS